LAVYAARCLQALKQKSIPFEWAVYKKRGQGRGDDGWWIPDDILKFLTRLPKTAEATPAGSIAWLYRYVCVDLYMWH
jgi:hypothetical protein